MSRPHRRKECALNNIHPTLLADLRGSLEDAGFHGDCEEDTALLAAMSTDNSVYQIRPDVVVSPRDAADVVTLMSVLEQPAFSQLPVTPRGGGTGTNGQSLNTGVILDMRRYMNRLLQLDPKDRWAEVEPGMVLDDLNDQLREHGLFFAPETSTSTRCTIGGMVSTDASGKGSRVYGKTSDNLLGLEIARGDGLLSSRQNVPGWAKAMLADAEAAARSGKADFVANTPKLNRRFTGYDLERACPDVGKFEWWRLFPGSEGTLGPITKVRVKLRKIEAEKRLIVARFDSFREALSAAGPLLGDNPTAIEVMDERVHKLALDGGLLERLPAMLRPEHGDSCAFVFLEFNGPDRVSIARRAASSREQLSHMQGATAIYVASDLAEIRALWSIRSAAVGLLGRVSGQARPIAFVEDCVVPPAKLPEFLDGFLEILTSYGLQFGIYGHADVGCLHIRPALDIDLVDDREKLVRVSDAIFRLVNEHNGIFWGEHGKGVRGAYLAEWIGADAYQALQGVKAAFDPSERFNPGKLVAAKRPLMGIATTPFRPFNAPEGDALQNAFRCNGNAQCLSYEAAVPMCPSFKATGDIRHSPKGRADALRSWHHRSQTVKKQSSERDLLNVLDTCLGCSACASSCPVQVAIPQMRSAFYSSFYEKNKRPLEDRMMLLAEQFSPWLRKTAPAMRPIWPLIVKLTEAFLGFEGLPKSLARPLPKSVRISPSHLNGFSFPANSMLILQDWFTELFDEDLQRDALAGLTALGYSPIFIEMLPAGKIAEDMGDKKRTAKLVGRLEHLLDQAAQLGRPMIGLDPAFVAYVRKRGIALALPQEFLVEELNSGKNFPRADKAPEAATVFLHCTEATQFPNALKDWEVVFQALGQTLHSARTGCCGMAGMFGHKIRHQTVSRKLFEMSWAKPLSTAKGQVAATGFSCRSQCQRLVDQNVRHPLGLISDFIKFE